MKRPNDILGDLASRSWKNEEDRVLVLNKDVIEVLQYIRWLEDERQRYRNANQNDDYDTSFSSVPG